LAIRAVARDELFLSSTISKKVVEVFLNQTDRSKTPLDVLTPRQREVLQLIGEGKTSKQIAQLLDSSVKTIECHRASLMDRLDLHEIAGLVRYAIRNGLVSAER